MTGFWISYHHWLIQCPSIVTNKQAYPCLYFLLSFVFCMPCSLCAHIRMKQWYAQDSGIIHGGFFTNYNCCYVLELYLVYVKQIHACWVSTQGYRGFSSAHHTASLSILEDIVTYSHCKVDPLATGFCKVWVSDLITSSCHSFVLEIWNLRKNLKSELTVLNGKSDQATRENCKKKPQHIGKNDMK